MKLPFAKAIVRKHVPPRAPAAAVATPPAAPAVQDTPRAVPPVAPEPEPAALPATRLEPGAADVRRRLLAHGASDAFCHHVLRRVAKSGAVGTFAIDEAARILGRSFRVAPSPKRRDEPHVLAFVGPPGSGKTTTLAKLGRRLESVGRTVAYASFDAAGLAALERVGGTTVDVDRTEVPLAAVRDAVELQRFLRRARGADLCLLDTRGASPAEGGELERLAAELLRCRGIAELDAYLVLPASASRTALSMTGAAFAPLACDAAVLTKLDETSEPGPVLEATLAFDLPVAFLADGQDARAHLHRPTRDHFADLFLRGKLG